MFVCLLVSKFVNNQAVSHTECTSDHCTVGSLYIKSSNFSKHPGQMDLQLHFSIRFTSHSTLASFWGHWQGRWHNRVFVLSCCKNFLQSRRQRKFNCLPDPAWTWRTSSSSSVDVGSMQMHGFNVLCGVCAKAPISTHARHTEQEDSLIW